MVSALSVKVVVVLALSAGLKSQSSPSDVLLEIHRGRPLVGKVVRRSAKEVVVATELGTVRLDAAAITSETSAERLKAEFSNLRQGKSADPVRFKETLFQWCIDRGYIPGALVLAKELLDETPDHKTLNSWLDFEALRIRPGRLNPHPLGTTRFEREEIDILFEAAEKADFVQAALIRRRLHLMPVEAQSTIVGRYAERGTDGQRWIAAGVLGRMNESRRVAPLYKMALLDGVWQIRREAVFALKVRDDGTTFRPFVRALMQSPYPIVKVAAAEALGNLGDTQGIAPLLYALKATDEPTSSTFFNAGTSQVAYVKDYDVEVAQTAFIADPVVDIVQDGYVHSVSVVSIQSARQTVLRALRRISGVNLGNDSSAWVKWNNTRGDAR